MVQATGVGSRFSYIPDVDNEEAYKGISLHSESFKNGNVLKEKGVKVRELPTPAYSTLLIHYSNQSVTIMGSANTAFDVMQACYQAGLETTMIQRSPTYVYPCDYLKNPNGLGIYDILPVNVADSVVNAGPIAVGGQLMYGLHQMLAGAEP